MIVFEDGIRAIIDQIPADIEGFKPKFHWGNEKELARYLKLVKQPYPLVWLVVGPEEHDLKEPEITRDVRFILSTREKNVNRLNDKRLIENFDKVLNPLTDRLIEGVTKSTRTSFLERKLKIQKHPNYSGYNEGSRSNSKNYTIDLWDAITIDGKIRMTNNCQNTIKWQTRK